MGKRVHSQRQSSAAGLWGALLAGLLLVLSGALAACGEEAGGAGPAVYTEADDGHSVPATVGDTITVQLTENPSTGYGWRATYSGGLDPVADEFVALSASPALVGAPGTRTFVFEVAAAGTQTFEAMYERAWETGAAGEFSLTIDVD